LAAQYIEALRVIQPMGPYLLGGRSFGGIVAYEMAQQLSKQGQRVDLLAMMDTLLELPQELAGAPDAVDLLYQLSRAEEAPFSLDALRRLDPGQQSRRLMDDLCRSRILPFGISVPEMKRFLLYIKAVCETSYAPLRYLGRVAFFRAHEQVWTAPKGQSLDAYIHRLYGWSTLLSQPLDVHEVPGNHQTMMREPGVRALAERLRRCLDAVDPLPGL